MRPERLDCTQEVGRLLDPALSESLGLPGAELDSLLLDHRDSLKPSWNSGSFRYDMLGLEWLRSPAVEPLDS